MNREEAHSPRHYDDQPAKPIKSPKRIPDRVRVAMVEAPKNPDGQTMDWKRISPVEPVLG